MLRRLNPPLPDEVSHDAPTEFGLEQLAETGVPESGVQRYRPLDSAW